MLKIMYVALASGPLPSVFKGGLTYACLVHFDFNKVTKWTSLRSLFS